MFVTPDTALAPGTHYLLRVKGAASAAGERFRTLSIAFDTDGETPEADRYDFIAKSLIKLSDQHNKMAAVVGIASGTGHNQALADQC